MFLMHDKPFRLEMNHFRPAGYVVATILVAIGGLLNGYDTGTIGAVTEMPHFKSDIHTLSPTMRGFTVSAVLLFGAFPGFVTGTLTDRFGALVIIAAGAVLHLLGSLLEAVAPNFVAFILGRVLCGLGQGLFISNYSVYICEIAPSARRGSLTATPQLFCCAGICLGYFTCYASVHLDDSLSWRTPYIVMTALSAALAASCSFLPQSPRWLLMRGHREKALREAKRLDFSQVEAEKELFGPAAIAAAEQHAKERLSPLESVSVIFGRQYRSRTILALFLLGMCQLCGIDGVLYYAPILFAQAGIPSSSASFLASGLSAILVLAISIPALVFIDRLNRRSVTLIGGAILATCMFIIGSLYASNSVHASTGAGRWIVIVLIFVFAMTYAATWAIVSKIYASEIQPARTRASANSIAQGLNFLANWLVAMITPIFLAESSFGAYFLYGGLTLGTVMVLALVMPETRGQSLEAIQEAFNTPANRSARLASTLRRLAGSGGERSSSCSSSLHHDEHVVEMAEVLAAGPMESR